jgi:ATP-dependent Clp protease ATP-binding subunit ClpA
MDYATLTDNNGKKADFRSVILIMTSNAGTTEMNRGVIGFGDRAKDTLSKGRDAVNRLFSAEFKNRLDAIVTFNSLTPDIMKKVVNKFIDELKTQLNEKRIKINVSEAAIDYLAKNGFDPQLGARPLARLIQIEIKDVLSEEVLFGRLMKGGKVYIDIADNKLAFNYNEE